MLSKPEAAEFDHPGSVLYFKFVDIYQFHQILRARGVDFVDPPRKLIPPDCRIHLPCISIDTPAQVVYFLIPQMDIEPVGDLR
jgi:hypothetical protein